MSLLPQDLIVEAANLSSNTSPQHLAPGGTELLTVLTRALRKYFALGVQYNREFFGDSAVVSFTSGGWTRPVVAETVYHLTHGGQPVIVVPFDDRLVDRSKRAVYESGQRYYSAGTALGPTSGDLTLHYSRKAQSVTALDVAIDALWPDDWAPLLVHELGIYLARKDGRDADAGAFTAELTEWTLLFTQFLKHATVETRRFARQWPPAAVEAETATA